MSHECLADLLSGSPDPRYRSLAAATGEGLGRPAPWVIPVIRSIAADLSDQGILVVFEAGWETRGRTSYFDPGGLVIHHTADQSHSTDYGILWLVRDGRSDLPGPLAQFGLGRRGTVYVIAAGTANHAGGGGWNGLSGNHSVWGIEAANDGIGEPWSPVQIENYLALSTAIARHSEFSADMIACHREWSDAGKIDPTGIDCPWFRGQVAGRLAGSTTPDPWADLFVPVIAS